jgi:hypothetical protein
MSKLLIVWGLLAALLTLALVGCGNDETTNSNTGVFNRIALQPLRFPTQKAGLVYEGWVVNIDADSNWTEYKSFGKFFWDEYNYRFLSPTDTTKYIDSVFVVDGNVYDYDMIAITLERYPVDDSPAPSPTIVAQSGIVPGQATKMEFPVRFGGETIGKFAIGTFSDGHYQKYSQSVSNEYYGIWFMDLTRKNIAYDTIECYKPGVTLPALPDTGYTYEGWVSLLMEGDSVLTLSTGKFFWPNIQDYDNKHCEAQVIPNYPGEDFLMNPIPNVPWPLNLVNFPKGGTAFITIEPNPDNDLSRPTNLVVLRGNLPIYNFAVRKSSYDMGNEAAVTFPKINVYFLQAK